jgi:hypothetical protein
MAILLFARDLFTRMQLFAARKSLFLYQSQNFVVHDRGLILPVANRISLEKIGDRTLEIAKVIEWTYAHCRRAGDNT